MYSVVGLLVLIRPFFIAWVASGLWDFTATRLMFMLKLDFTHLFDVLQERLKQMKSSYYEFTDGPQQKLDVNR